MQKIKLIAILLLVFLMLPACDSKTAKITIEANIEGAEVIVNQAKAGATPLEIAIEPGQVEITVKKEGYESVVFSDSIAAHQSKILTANLLTYEEIAFRDNTSGVFTDKRDGKKYTWVKIGSQIWMAENLAHVENTEGFWPYMNDADLVPAYGYLYTWKIAQRAAPEGWHIPSKDEWNQLSATLGGDFAASGKLREQGYTHWVDGYHYRPIATNASGFTARPGGQRTPEGKFLTLGTYGNWWSSTSDGPDKAFGYWLGYMSDHLNEKSDSKKSAFSLRCVKD